MFISSFNIENNEKYEKLEPYIICPICDGVISDPLKCINCQKSFCKICINEWKKNHLICPFRCSECILEPNEILKKILCEILVFKCEKGCGALIPYSKLYEHFNDICPNREKKDLKEEFENIATEFEKLKVQKENMLDEKNEVIEKISELQIENSKLKIELNKVKQKYHFDVIYENLIKKQKVNEYWERKEKEIEDLKNQLKQIIFERNEKKKLIKKKNFSKKIVSSYEFMDNDDFSVV